MEKNNQEIPFMPKPPPPPRPLILKLFDSYSQRPTDRKVSFYEEEISARQELVNKNAVRVFLKNGHYFDVWASLSERGLLMVKKDEN